MMTNKIQLFLSYLFIPNQLYMFRTMSSSNIRNTLQYLQLLILSTDIAAGWCHVMDEMELSSISSVTPSGSNIGVQYKML